MKNIKITLEGSHKLDADSIAGSFGVPIRDVQNLKKKCFELSNNGESLTATDLLVKVIEEDLITGPIGLVLLTLGLQRI